MDSKAPFVLKTLDESSSEYKTVEENFTKDAGQSFGRIYEVRTVDHIKL